MDILVVAGGGSGGNHSGRRWPTHAVGTNIVLELDNHYRYVGDGAMSCNDSREQRIGFIFGLPTLSCYWTRWWIWCDGNTLVVLGSVVVDTMVGGNAVNQVQTLVNLGWLTWIPW